MLYDRDKLKPSRSSKMNADQAKQSGIDNSYAFWNIIIIILSSFNRVVAV